MLIQKSSASSWLASSTEYSVDLTSKSHQPVLEGSEGFEGVEQEAIRRAAPVRPNRQVAQLSLRLRCDDSPDHSLDIAWGMIQDQYILEAHLAAFIGLPELFPAKDAHAAVSDRQRVRLVGRVQGRRVQKNGKTRVLPSPCGLKGGAGTREVEERLEPESLTQRFMEFP